MEFDGKVLKDKKDEVWKVIPHAENGFYCPECGAKLCETVREARELLERWNH